MMRAGIRNARVLSLYTYTESRIRNIGIFRFMTAKKNIYISKQKQTGIYEIRCYHITHTHPSISPCSGFLQVKATHVSNAPRRVKPRAPRQCGRQKDSRPGTHSGCMRIGWRRPNFGAAERVEKATMLLLLLLLLLPPTLEMMLPLEAALEEEWPSPWAREGQGAALEPPR